VNRELRGLVPPDLRPFVGAENARCVSQSRTSRAATLRTSLSEEPRRSTWTISSGTAGPALAGTDDATVRSYLLIVPDNQNAQRVAAACSSKSVWLGLKAQRLASAAPKRGPRTSTSKRGSSEDQRIPEM